jgi:hypothetical protein
LYFNNKVVVLPVACQQDGVVLEYASQKLKDDDEVLLAACGRWGCPLSMFASDRLKDEI